MKKNEPAIKANTVHNHHFLYGLIGSKNIKGKNYVDGMKNYKVKHSITFTDGLLQYVTLGIYTPSTTHFYVPLNQTGKKAKKAVITTMTTIENKWRLVIRPAYEKGKRQE